MPIKKIVHIIILVLHAGFAKGQQKTISCIALRSYHTFANNDSTESKYLRTLWFDICDKGTSLSKQWQFDQNGKTVGQQLTYINSLTNRFIELDWKEDDSSYVYHFISMDTALNRYVNFHAYVKNDRIQTSNYETKEMRGDSVIIKLYNTENVMEMMTPLNRWIQLDSNSMDSLSVPSFPDIKSVQGDLISVVISANSKEKLESVFHPLPQSYSPGAKRIPKHIIASTRRVAIRKNKFHKRRKHQEKGVQMLYDIYFRTNTK